jgi:hypothetical protein
MASIEPGGKTSWAGDVWKQVELTMAAGKSAKSRGSQRHGAGTRASVKPHFVARALLEARIKKVVLLAAAQIFLFKTLVTDLAAGNEFAACGHLAVDHK